MSSALSLFACCAFVLLFTACGQKPDGTPYGVNPTKHPHGHRKTAPDSARRNDIYADGMPKGAEMNAVTNGATVGQPMHAPMHTPMRTAN